MFTGLNAIKWCVDSFDRKKIPETNDIQMVHNQIEIKITFGH